MEKTHLVLVIVIIILVGLLSFAAGYYLISNSSNNTNNTSVTNQTNISVSNNISNEDNQPDIQYNNVSYRINSNAPDCPNCGSNNIAQLSDTKVDASANEWVVESQCRYCGYQWEHRVSRDAYT